jgi:DNA-binding transcriptional LysR family regulator
LHAYQEYDMVSGYLLYRRGKILDIANLQAFIVVAGRESFSAAAEQLYLTQPAVSKRIAALEEELEVRLFDRIGRRITLTEAGRTLLPRARRILSELEDSRRALSNLSGQISGKLTIATSHHTGLHRLPPGLREFATNYPKVQLDMRFIDSELGCDMITTGEAELAIVTLPLQPRPQLECLPIWDDPLIIVINGSHALAGRDRVEPEELAAYPAILPGEITFTRRLVDRFFEQRGISLTMSFATNYLETIKMMVTVGLGWSVLPQTMVDAGLAKLEVSGFDVRRTLGAVRHINRTSSNAAQAMLTILMNQ